MRTKLVIANWKMNLDISESVQLAKKLKLSFLKKLWQDQVVICPDFLSLSSVYQALNKTKIRLGAQNCFWQEVGAYTGEISPKNLKQVKADFVILGHSERRYYFKEKNEEIALKVDLALKTNIKPIVCVGEALTDHQKGRTLSTLKKQVKQSLQGIKLKSKDKIVLAYEPVWAIGNGKNLDPKEVVKILSFLKAEIAKVFSSTKAENNFSFIYGGSVSAENVKDFAKFKEIQGLLVGSSSLKLRNFSKICNDFLS
ncbi:MAG: triose-phosphate isomerase [Candidatus Pacebacteria bacterium]|nr:triose-phosphate isomerase [Candidatus Paceibacterota bacterium]